MPYTNEHLAFTANLALITQTYRSGLANAVGSLSLDDTAAAEQAAYAAELLPQFGYQRQSLTFTGAHDATDNRWESTEVTVNFAIAGGSVSYNHILTFRNPANTGACGAQIATVTPATGTLSFAAPHGLTANDRIMLAGTAGATAPGGTSLGIFYWAEVASPDTLRLRATSGGAAIATFTNAGSGTLFVRFCQGKIAVIDAVTSTQILDGQSKSVKYNGFFARS